MRMRAGESSAEALARMPQRQSQLLDRVVAEMTEFREVTQRLEVSRAVLYSRIHRALQDGVPAQILSDVTDLSVSEIYRIRSKVQTIQRAS